MVFSKWNHNRISSTHVNYTHAIDMTDMQAKMMAEKDAGYNT